MSNTQHPWLAYNAENNSFSTLPAGPMLLPAIGIFAFIALVRLFKEQPKRPEQILGKTFYKSSTYQKDKARFNYLMNKKIMACKQEGPELSIEESAELRRLRTPDWNGGREWSEW